MKMNKGGWDFERIITYLLILSITYFIWSWIIDTTWRMCCE